MSASPAHGGDGVGERVAAAALAAGLRAELERRGAELRERFEAGAPASEVTAARAAAVDGALRAAWDGLGLGGDGDAALVAVGGYGRGELHPGSDVDLLVLLGRRRGFAPKRRRPDGRIEAFVALLWDIGLEVGHSVRSVRECASAARGDLTVITNLVEARLLAGPPALFEKMREAVAPARMWPAGEFFRAKEREQRERHLGYRDSRYRLEPNVKEGPGGLRDLQTVAWVARRLFGPGGGAPDPGLRDLFDHGFLTEEEFRELRDGRHFLWQVRTALHHLARRREDRLLFELQIAVAERFGYRDAAHNLAVEQFMKRYYRTIQSLSRLNEMLLQLFRERFLDGGGDGTAAAPGGRAARGARGEVRPLNRRFQVRGGQLETVGEDVFRRRPFALLELFLLLQQDPAIDGVRAATIRQVRRHLHLVDDEFRADLACRSLFLEILREPHGLAHALRRMHAYGVLGRYLPEFGRIEGLMQFDLFHVYTVDEHLLRTVSHLRRFALPEHRGELPHCADLFATLPKPELLYLAGLFHDIAKGRGSDHSEDGAREAAAFCERHGLGAFDSGLVAWLVRHHLAMSTTAQREDLSDPDVIRRFAGQVGDEVRLDYLYLLTVADIRATNPSLWTDWKDALLRDLHQGARRVLLHGVDAPPPTAEELARACREEARRRLAGDVGGESGGDGGDGDAPGGTGRASGSGAPDGAEALWETLETDYFVRTAPEAVAWHTAEALAAGARPLVAVRTWRKRTEAFFRVPDRDHLFAAAAATLERLGLTVVDARVFTTGAGLSFDSFTVAESDGRPIEDAARREDIRRELARALEDPRAAAGRAGGRRPRRQLESFDIPVRVAFDDRPAGGYTVMEVACADRPGVLSRIGQALARSGVSVHGAKIATFGERAEDVFRIAGRDGRPLDEREREALRTEVLRALEAPAQPPVTGGKKATSSPSATG